ncbi:MAG: hypothetical protein AB1758_23815 [Candidatus Eremiobacterota bacterium]
MLKIAFEGWFQVRLATDPDPSDEPRGVSGTTFALAGEPDFDRVVRFHDPVAPRLFGQVVGVFVRGVYADGRPVQGHPLLGGRAELLDRPTFANHNNIVTISETEPMDPFHLKLSSPDGTLWLARDDHWDPARPGLSAFEAPPEWMARRLGKLGKDSEMAARATGIADYAGYRRDRREALQRRLQAETDAVARTALEKRIRELARADDQYPQERLGYCMTYRFDLNGTARVHDPDGRLGGTPDATRDWPLDLWMGAYDSDTLCGYTVGCLTVPLS